MLKISNVKIYGLEESIIASGYPMQDNINSDIINENDWTRAKKLGNTNSNSGHGNFLTGIIVQFDVTYSQYWSMQLQRYHFIQIISSQSKMHRLKSMSIDDSCNKYVSPKIKECVKEFQKEYNDNPSYENYMRLISNLPMGFMLTMRVDTNYMQLKNIYRQRRTHKLKEDWGVFCDWIETLPYFIKLTGVKK